MAFKNPTPKTEEMYFKSINTSVDQYRAYLEELRTGSLQLTNMDLDTGKKTQAAEYTLTDDSYAKLLAKLSERKFDRTSPELRAEHPGLLFGSLCSFRNEKRHRSLAERPDVA